MEIKKEKKIKKPRSQNPKNHLIQFWASDALFNAIMTKANESPRFRGQPNMYVKHRVEKDFTPDDTQSLLKLNMAIANKLETLNNKLDIMQITSEKHLEFSIGKHPQTEEEEIDDIENSSRERLEIMTENIIKSALRKGSAIQRTIIDSMIERENG